MGNEVRRLSEIVAAWPKGPAQVLAGRGARAGWGSAREESRRWARLKVRLVSVLCAAGMMALAPAVTKAPPAAAATESSDVDGGGFQNTVAVDPHGTGIVISGADIAGFQVGSANGATFAPRNAAAGGPGDLSIASIRFATKTNTIYAGAGAGGTANGFWTSHDGGQTWSRPTTGTTVPSFNGVNPDRLNHRSTGNLIALDESTTPPTIFVATYSGGVMRSVDDGATWISIGLSGKYLRSIAIDPLNANTVYAAAYDDGVYVSTKAKQACTDPCSLFGTAPIVGSPLFPEELVALGGTKTTLYAAAAASTSPAASGGAYKYDSGKWSALGTGTLSSSAIWFSIDGYVSGDGVRHLVIGCRDLCESATGSWGTLFQNLYRSDDGGSTWTSLILPPSVIHADETGGPGGPSWWESTGSAVNMLGQPLYGAAQIAVDPTNTQRIFVAGRSGVWRSEDGGLNWYPVVDGMAVSQGMSVAVDRVQSNRVYLGVGDWAFLYSEDRGDAVENSSPGGGPIGSATAVDPVNSRVYLAPSDGDLSSGGDVYSADPTTMAWVSEGLGAVDGGKEATGIAVDQVSGQPIVIASVYASGIWRKSSGSWSHVLTNTSFGDNQPAVSWVHGSNLVYVYDRNTGLWRSLDFGVTWTLIWAQTTLGSLSGWVAADPTQTSRVYAYVDAGLYRLTNAGGTPVVTLLTLASGGPVAVDTTGAVWVAGLQSATALAKLYRSTDQGVTWPSFDDDYYRNAAGWPTQIAVAPDGYQYISLLYGGMVVGQPIGSAVIPTVSALSPNAGPLAGGTVVTVSGSNFTGATDVWFGRNRALSFTVVNSTTILATSPAGTKTVDVTVSGSSATSAPVAGDLFTYSVAPTVTTVTPATGSTGGGTLVTVKGTNFLTATGVSFGAVPATSFTVSSKTKITATSPAGTGTVDVTVTGPGGTSATSAADLFTYWAPPSVTAVTPTSGTTSGGTVVTITGTGFDGATAVKFGTPATTFTVVSSTKITATTPTHSAATVDVTVTGPGGTSASSSADQYTFAATPSVTSVSPSSGPTTGGTVVIVKGTGFLNATSVKFGAVPATTFTVNSSSKITATAPAGALGTVDVTVSGPGGTSAITSADKYTYALAPSISSLSPASGTTAGGTVVTITGTSFTGATAVKFGTKAATTFTVISDSKISVTSPSHSVGLVDVTVVGPGGTSPITTADQYTYV